MNGKSYFPKLSKSKFIAGMQCLKYLHLKCYTPELAPPIDPVTKSIFEQGHKVGILAQQAFPGGVLVEEDHFHHREAAVKTEVLLEKQDIQAIYEAAFEHERIQIRADVLARTSDYDWKLIEVKSTTRVKDYHLFDIAIQDYVLRGNGISISNTFLMHLNREYIYDGDEYNLEELFTAEELTDEVAEVRVNIREKLNDQWECLKLKNPPDISPGPQCKSPVECPFFDICNEEKSIDWVGYLPGIGSKKLEILNINGIESISDIPDEFSLTKIQNRVCESVKLNKPYFDDDMHESFSELQYPLFYMDFETISPAIPLFSRTKPFDQIPFQWSVHTQKDPFSEPEHFDFLAQDENDPRELFLVSLLTVLERSEGHIVVYNKSFESTCLKNLALWLPDYALRIKRIQERLWDLLKIVKDNVYHPDFWGSFSIKNVLPALVPEMTYEGMEVADGKMAGVTFTRLISEKLPQTEKNKLRQALIDYCKQDTLAMVKLMDRLRKRLV